MEWIPIADRLPSEGETVLVTVWEDLSYGKGTEIRIHVDLAVFQASGGYISVNDEEGFDTYNDWLEGQPCKITAWMPLPEPYKEEQK